MNTAWTIRSRRNAPNVRRPASLTSLPDLSDELEIGSRPSSDASGLFDSWDQTPYISNTSNCQSNISVSFLGSCIRRQYRSSFLLSDEQVVGVSRCETFHPEDAKADVRINIAVQGPPNESITPGYRRSQSVPSLLHDNLNENGGWARLMLTTDRPQGSEILGRIGSRNYFAKVGINSPYFHRRITPMKKEEEYIIELNEPRKNPELEREKQTLSASLLSGTASDGEPSIDRFEKETFLDTARRHGSPNIVATSTAVSYLPRASLSDKNAPQSSVPEASSPSTNPLSSENLPSTERSESFLHLKRSKTKSSLSLHTLNSVGTPWNEPIRQKSSAESPMRESATPHIDNTLSLHTDLDEDCNIEKAQGMDAEKGSLLRVQRSEDNATGPSVLSFFSATNGLGGPDGQERISSYYGHKHRKSTILYTTLHNNNGHVVNLGLDDSTKTQDSNKIEDTNECITSESIKLTMDKDVDSIEYDSHPPLPKERKRKPFEQAELPDDASQTDYSRTDSSSLTQFPEKDSYSEASRQSFGE
ncbi:unnamed protein product [Rodentolepis nana]|uniref:Pecanex-like protein n=1 Tax=Rodentolepis nana TaxID=102285 RepID=A0A0R3T259_RODNA|nr:unnamed protein product [Rodentolepis nana]